MTILTDEMLEFFIKNNFSILVSLDGPPSIHNRYRIYTNEKGSFATIEMNLIKIKNISEDFYKKKISFNMVLAPPYNFELIDQFVASSDLFHNSSIITCNFIDRYDTEFFKQFVDDDLDLPKHLDIFVTKFIDFCNSDKINEPSKNTILTKSIIKSSIRSVYNSIFSGETSKLNKIFKSHSLCIPGLNRLYVNAVGNLYPCERVAEGENMKIGNVFDGINVDHCLELIKTYYQLVNDDCVNCWAIRLCNALCFRSWMDKELNYNERRKEICQGLRFFYSIALKDVIRISEEAPKAFHFLIDKSSLNNQPSKSN
jgi:uncharacterized protein